MTDTTPAPATRTWTRWLYPALAVTGIAVGVFVIAAGLYLLFANPSCCASMEGGMRCCAAMQENMRSMMEGMPSMPNMPSMPSTPMPSPPR